VIRCTRVFAAVTTALLAIGLVGTPASADGPELVPNGTFDTGHSPWWATSNITLTSTGGKLCAAVPGGTAAGQNAIVGLSNMPLKAGDRFRLTFTATASVPRLPRVLVQLPVAPFTPYLDQRSELGTDARTFTYTFLSAVDLPTAQIQFHLGGNADSWTFCLDDVSFRGGATPDLHVPDTGPRVRVNQVGYLPDGPKRATLVTTATRPVFWELKNSRGRVVEDGRSKPRGVDVSSAQNVHTIDFTDYDRKGTGFTLVADGQTSRPFDIGVDFYEKLRLDALKFYYSQRSGVEIRNDLRPGYGRPAGHVDVAPNRGDKAVPCAPSDCSYTLDVTGGWYDAGDHGKYVVNGGISVYQLMNLWERSTIADTGQPKTLRDGTLALPESGNGVPDVLDEARFEQEWMLKMQVPAGQPLAGMAHHTIHDVAWTGLPLLPHRDPQPRQLYPPTTAATLNLAATAAQAARVYRPYDRAFATKNLAAARTAWAAALANPNRIPPQTSVGGGPYYDATVTDEFYWAAAELYLTTGEREFRSYLLSSPLHTADVFTPGGFYWGSVAVLARLDLALIENDLPGGGEIRRSVLRGADGYLTAMRNHGYGVPYAPDNNKWEWGSTSGILNNAVVMGIAYDLSGREKYRAGVIETMDFILGRNALNQSYVTGYGEVASKNQHSRWYARQLDLNLPNPPVGTLAGGPNSSIQDPVAKEKLAGCVAQFCYIDDIQSWSTNELTINWNAPLAWVAAFVADQDGGAR
jgi:endoglucanase